MQTFNLDLSVKRVIPLLNAKQRNAGMKILVRLTDNKEKYTVPDGVTWSVWYSGANGEGNYDKIDDRDAVVVDVEAGTATVELVYQMLDNPGPGEMCLVMNGADGTQLGLWNIPYFVEALPGADSKAATVYYQAFLQAREGAEDAAAKSEAAAGRSEAAAENAQAAAKEAANKKPQDLKVTATFDTVVNDTISTGTADVSAYDVATAISKGATVTLIDDDNRVYKYCGYRLEPNYSNAFFEAQEIDANGITTYTANINNEGQASRTKYTHEYAAANTDPDRHAEYFTITDDGVVSLKPEYRGACERNDCPYGISDNGIGKDGSLIVDLPEDIAIPTVVNEMAVITLAPAMFAYNRKIRSLTIPSFIRTIPARLCEEATNFQEVEGGDNVEIIEKGAFQYSGIKRIAFPKLKELGEFVFSTCVNLVVADLGSTITSFPRRTFTQCEMLTCVRNAENVATVGKEAFYRTQRLKNLGFLARLTSIGDLGFRQSAVDYDWASLPNCTFGTNATALQWNPTDFWSGCTFDTCKITLRSTFNQENPLWLNSTIGNTAITYKDGCNVCCSAMVCSIFDERDMTSPREFEYTVQAVNPSLMDLDPMYFENIKQWLEAVGYTVDHRTSFNSANLQDMYNALTSGALVIAETITHDSNGGHAVVFHGINDRGELLVVDPSAIADERNGYKAATYSMSIKNLCVPGNQFMIIRK